MPRRSSRRGVAASKAKARQSLEYETAKDEEIFSGKLKPVDLWKREKKPKVLALALPSNNEPDVSKKIIKKAFDSLDPSQRLELALKRGTRQTRNKILALSGLRRHILFMRISDERILEATIAIQRNGILPPWTRNLSKFLSVQNNSLFFREGQILLKFALKDEKRRAVKLSYFDPKLPATILPITLYLREKYCNITKKEVTTILRSLETYQRQFRRYQHPKILSSTFFSKPGVIACDTFFTSAQQGWKPTNVLAIMDVYSRFCRAYALEKKERQFFKPAIEAFCKELLSMQIMPRRILSDKGSELTVAAEVMEKFRLKRDGDKPLHLRSYTGQPVGVIENLNAQISRRLEIFRISDLAESPNQLLFDITEQLNHQPRVRKKNYTPYELIKMPSSMRNKLNLEIKSDYNGVSTVPQEKLQFLKAGDSVRKLLLNYKEQQTNKLKGFQAKWSKEVYEVLRISSLIRNPLVKRYTISEPKGRQYFRHELLKITEVDSEVIRIPGSTSLEVVDYYRPE
jgi:hypothetical protein